MDQTDLLHNKGVLAINIPIASPEEKTVIVLGAARGGTSMVAGALHRLGVFMGEGLSEVYEDVALSQAVEQNRIGDIISLIARNNEAHSLWGWKRPSAIKHVSVWEGKLRNPHYIVVFRDLFAIANRNRISMLSNVTDSMRDAARQFNLILDFVGQVKEPILLVSYEKAMDDPQHFVHALNNFVGLNGRSPIDDAIAFIKRNPENYLKMSRITNAIGAVDIAEGNRIGGWAMYPQSPQRVAEVRIQINNDREFIVPATHFRKDLLEKGVHPTGHCGFLVVLATEDTLQSNDVVRIRVIGDITDLRRSGRHGK